MESCLKSILTALQLCLAVWQIMKLSPVGAIIQGGMGWLLSLLSFRLSPAYALLRPYEGRVFKKVHCAVLTEAGPHAQFFTLPSHGNVERDCFMRVCYLGHDFEVRRDRNKLFVNGKMSHYITDAQWERLSKMRAHGLEVGVFVTGYKQFWGLMVTGSVLTFIEALDFIILDNYTVQLSNSVWFIPVSLSVSEGKLLKVLNLVGLFLLTKKVFWLIPSLLSIASAMLELNTTMRTWLYTSIGRLFCWSVHLICDKLPYSMRRRVYSWGQWVENFQPFNDIQLRVVRSPICAVIGGGAKAHMEGATLVRWLNVGGETIRSFDCASNLVTIKCCNPDRIVITCMLFERFNKCGVAVGKPDDELADEFAVVGVDCNNRVEFMKLCTFLSCIAKNSSGSFICYDSSNKAHVRGWKESVRHYVESGFPPVYELKLQPAIVNGT